MRSPLRLNMSIVLWLDRCFCVCLFLQLSAECVQHRNCSLCNCFYDGIVFVTISNLHTNLAVSLYRQQLLFLKVSCKMLLCDWWVFCIHYQSCCSIWLCFVVWYRCSSSPLFPFYCYEINFVNLLVCYRKLVFFFTVLLTYFAHYGRSTKSLQTSTYRIRQLD